MIQYQINPQYQYLKERILELPVRFEREGKVIYRGRNLIKVMDLEGREINVKSFKRPHILNRFVYAWFRSTKAERSYINAFRLMKMGIGTPDPLGYIVCKGNKGITRSYYISIQQECDYVLLDLLQERPADLEDLFRAYVRFVYDFHQKGVYFVDLSTGNTLIRRGSDGEPSFYLVDLNRMFFCRKKMSWKEGISNFRRIDLEEADLDFVVKEYARLCGRTEKELWHVLDRCKAREQFRRWFKDVLKTLIGKKKR